MLCSYAMQFKLWNWPLYEVRLEHGVLVIVMTVSKMVIDLHALHWGLVSEAFIKEIKYHLCDAFIKKITCSWLGLCVLKMPFHFLFVVCVRAYMCECLHVHMGARGQPWVLVLGKPSTFS